MGKRKLTLSIREDLLSEVRIIALREGRSLSELVEEYFEYLVSARWAESLARELGLGPLEPTTEQEIPETRPRGLDAARAMRELRDERSRRTPDGTG